MGNRMSSLVILGDTSGSITLQVPAAAGSGTVHTLPAATGTVMVSGNMPTFYAYAAATPSFSGSTPTKVQFNTETIDTANCYDTSTYRFTPNVAGYYLINCSVAMVSSGATQWITMVYKNGSNYARWESRATQNYWLSGGSTIVYLNGSTDYIEGYLYCSGSGYIDNGAQYTCMSGILMRAGAA